MYIYFVFKKHRQYEAKHSKRTIKSACREIFVYPERVFQANGNQSVSERRISKGELISATRCANPVRPSLLLWGARNARYPLFSPADCRLPRHVNVNVPDRANAGYFPGLIPHPRPVSVYSRETCIERAASRGFWFRIRHRARQLFEILPRTFNGTSFH